jgi:F0F1-type ATP synthase membrane subunit b/b'
MTDGMDWMDVQAMVEKAVAAEKWSRNRHIEDVEKDLRREFRREVMELREEVGELVAEVHKLIEREAAIRGRQDLSLQTIVLNRQPPPS